MPPRPYTTDGDFRPGQRQLYRSGTSDTVLPEYSVEDSAPTYKAKTNMQILAETIKRESETYEKDAARATEKSQSSHRTSSRAKYDDMATYNTEMAKFGRMVSRYMLKHDPEALAVAQESYKSALTANPAVDELDKQHVSMRMNALSAVVFSQCPDPDSVVLNDSHRSRTYWSAYRRRGDAENHRKLRANVLELELGDAKDSRGRSVSGDIGQTTTGSQGEYSRTGPVSSNASRNC